MIFDHARSGQHDIARLQIAVINPATVHVLEPGRHLVKDPDQGAPAPSRSYSSRVRPSTYSIKSSTPVVLNQFFLTCKS